MILSVLSLLLLVLASASASALSEPKRIRILAHLAVLLVVSLAPTGAALARDEPFQVLVLHSFRQSLPVNTDWYSGILAGFASAPDLRINIEVEALDLDRHSEAGYVPRLTEIIRSKYADVRFDLIIPTYTLALKFLLDHGEEMFPGVPIVFCGADAEFVVNQNLPPRVTGVTSYLDIKGTVELVLELQPNTRQLALVVGSGPLDALVEARARRDLKIFQNKMTFIWLRGKPLSELLAAVEQLPPDTPILYLVQLLNRNGKSHFPFYTKRLYGVANAPIYGLWDTLIGQGIVGGRLITIKDDGFQAAQMALRILQGESPASIPVAVRTANPVVVDGRELARWRIPEDRLPANAQIRHRQKSIWEQYAAEIMIAVAVFVVQGLLIAVLALNRRRLQAAQVSLSEELAGRTRAEGLAMRLRARLARFSKERSLGTMVTTISHEINQPLVAIQNYAQAGKMRLQSDVHDRPKLIDLFANIEGEAERAGTITERVRSLVSSGDPQLLPITLHPQLEAVARMMESEAGSRGCAIVCEPAGDLPAVLGDALQIQLVLVNLLNNAMKSVCSRGGYGKRIGIDVAQIENREVQVSVTDWGSGVPPDRVAEIFEPLYSGSGGGMGMGLAIAQSIIDAHGGRLWYEPNPAGGAIFRFTLRAAGA